MSNRLPPLNPLRAFEVTARTGSVTAAAKELNVTHSAVSHQIKTIEEYLQIALFERSGRRLKLAGQGEALLPKISAAFDQIASATAEVSRPVTSGELRIGCVSAVLTYWLMPRLTEFSRLYPGIRLRLESTNSPEGLYRSNIDVSILYGDGSWQDLWVKSWAKLRLFPVASPTLLNSIPVRSIRDLQRHTLLHSGDNREWQSWLADVDSLDLLKTHHYVMTDAYLTTEAALLGQGIALGDTLTSEHLLARGALVAPFSRTVSAVDQMYLACRMESRSAPIVQAFIDWASDAQSGVSSGPRVSQANPV